MACGGNCAECAGAVRAANHGKLDEIKAEAEAKAAAEKAARAKAAAEAKAGLRLAKERAHGRNDRRRCK